MSFSLCKPNENDMTLIKSSTALKVEPRGRMQSSLQMQQQTTQHALYEFCQSVWAISMQYDVVFKKQQAKCIRFLTCCHIIEKEIIKNSYITWEWATSKWSKLIFCHVIPDLPAVCNCWCLNTTVIYYYYYVKWTFSWCCAGTAIKCLDNPRMLFKNRHINGCNEEWYMNC